MAKLTDFFTEVTLASQSIARKALLEDMGMSVLVATTNADESHQETDPSLAVQLLAERKLASYRQHHPVYKGAVLTCDTLVSCKDLLLGKASSRKEAKKQLTLFTNYSQVVHSGWALWYDNKIFVGNDQAKVIFKKLDEHSIEKYLDCGEWVGAAGSYRIQGQGKELVQSIEGDIATVIGLPLLQISAILQTNCARL